MFRYNWLLIALLILQPQVMASEQIVKQPLKVGFLYAGSFSDKGWTAEHERGRLYVQNTMKGKVETSCVENVQENGEAERVMERMIAQGCKLIFATSYGYLESVLKESAKHSDVVFMQSNRFKNRKNLGSYFIAPYEPMYLAGVIAGRMTKSNKLGYVGMRVVAPLIQSVNGYALGVRSVNPRAKIKVVWTNTWSDPVIEVEAAKSLMETGIDILAFSQGGFSPLLKLAEDNHLKVVGAFTTARELAPTQWLTGVSFNWGPFYAQICQSVIDHTWKSKEYLCDIRSGSIDLAPFGPLVPNAVRQEVVSLKDKMKTGKLVIFAGPVKDAQGKMHLSAGEKPSIDWISKMNFFVPGIDGNLPKN